MDEIVRAHCGELLIESEVGKGSAFTIVLPIKQELITPDDEVPTAEPDTFEDDQPDDDTQADELAEAV